MGAVRVEIPTARYFERQVKCREACPILTDAGGYVRAVAEGRDAGAYALAAEPNPLVSICGRICAHPCEDACRRGALDRPVAIRALKRFATERHGVESPDPALRLPPVPAPPARLPAVAVVGGGPAGLACAHDLRRRGHAVTIFEASPVAGGMVALGIPEYRIPRALIRAEIDRILGMGVELRTGWRLGDDFTLRELLDGPFRAVFLGIGVYRGRTLRVPGADADGVINGVDFLINVNLGYRVELGQKVAVIGGGDVAMDVARTALRDAGTVEDGSTMVDVARAAIRLGAREVHIFSLESRRDLPAHTYEVEEAEREGIVLHPSRGPKRILAEGGKVHGAEFLHVASVFDHEGRFNPRMVEGSEESFEADTVLLAIGQALDARAFRGDPDLALTPRGMVQVEEETLATSVPGVHAGGDCAFGPRNIIKAIADGRRAAAAIHRAVAGPGRKTALLAMKPLPVLRTHEPYERTPRVEIPTVPVNRRTGFLEVEVGYSEPQARAEAARCLWCHVHPIFDSDRCVLCGGCADVCPEGCLRLVPAGSLRGPADLARLIEVRLGAGGRGGAIVMDEERCIRCGLCAARCPTAAVSMELCSWRESA